MTQITLDQLADAAIAALGMGITYEDEKCDKFVRNSFARAGGKMDTYAGSNDMFRRACTKIVPLQDAVKSGELRRGWLLFIRDFDDEEPRQYQGDGLGNAWHVGIYTGPGDPEVMHSSASRGGVAASTLKNAWNMAGPPKAATVAPTAQPVAQASTSTDRLLKVTSGKPLLTGADVVQLQDLLIDAGYLVGASGADGFYGKDTATAVREYQLDNGLDADGIVGPLTWAVLRENGQETPPDDAAPLYTATINDLTDADLTALIAAWPRVVITKN